MTKFALYVPLQAKPGKEKEVADFLRSAVPLVNAEPGTITWFAIQEGPSSFAIFDTFDDEAGREAHLNGKVAAALMAKAGELLAKPPTIHKIAILADKPPEASPRTGDRIHSDGSSAAAVLRAEQIGLLFLTIGLHDPALPGQSACRLSAR